MTAYSYCIMEQTMEEDMEKNLNFERALYFFFNDVAL